MKVKIKKIKQKWNDYYIKIFGKKKSKDKNNNEQKL